MQIYQFYKWTLIHEIQLRFGLRYTIIDYLHKTIVSMTLRAKIVLFILHFYFCFCIETKFFYWLFYGSFFLFKSNLIMTRCVIAIGQRLRLTVDANCSRLYPRSQIINTPYQNQKWLSILVVIVNLVMLLGTVLIEMIPNRKIHYC